MGVMRVILLLPLLSLSGAPSVSLTPEQGHGLGYYPVAIDLDFEEVAAEDPYQPSALRRVGLDPADCAVLELR